MNQNFEFPDDEMTFPTVAGQAQNIHTSRKEKGIG